jgi:hypothetical protein
MIAPFVLDGPINRSAFDIVVMDNLSSHKGTEGARLSAALLARLQSD